MGKVLWVVCCVVLKDELASVLSKNREIKGIYIVSAEEGAFVADQWVHLLPNKEIHLLEMDELETPARNDRFSALIWFKPAGHHDNSEELRLLVKSSAMHIKDHAPFILLFFGLCRNSLWHSDRMAQEIGKPLMILLDPEGREVDDFFGANFGGKAAYLEGTKKNRGTISTTPGYAENWSRRQARKSLEKTIEQLENMRFVFERME